MLQSLRMADFLRNCPPVKPRLARGVRKMRESCFKKISSQFYLGEGRPTAKRHDLSKSKQRHRHQAHAPG